MNEFLRHLQLSLLFTKYKNEIYFYFYQNLRRTKKSYNKVKSQLINSYSIAK